jgi:predicted amidohydrolase YtcJ
VNSATTLLTNGRIYRTAFDERPASAMLVRGDQVAWIGDANDAPSASKVWDLERATVIPGLTDSHLHLIAIAQNRLQLSLSSPEELSVADVLSRLSAYAAEKPESEWIAASDFNEERLSERRMPTREEIDTVMPDRPVLVRRYCGHTAIVNSAALRKLGIGDGVDDPPGGTFGRSPTGALDGSAHEKAAERIFAAAKTVEDAALVSSIRSVIEQCNRLGIVAAVEAAIGFTNGFEEEERIWELLRGEGRLPIRLGFMMQLDPKEARSRNIRPTCDRDWQRATLKYFADGIISGRTAAVSQPYCDTCSKGLFVRPEEELDRVIIDAHRDGWQVAVHAIGDRAIDRVILALETAQLELPRIDTRHRIEHYFCPPAGGYARMKRLGAMIVMQPSFLSRMNKSIRAALGERADHSYPGQSVLRAGVQFVASSDAPTGLLSPWAGMAAAVDRAARDGDAIGENEAVTTRQAIAAYTSAGAYAMKQESWRGSLFPGMAADLIVLDRDPIEATVDELLEAQIIATVVRGEIVFGASA